VLEADVEFSRLGSWSRDVLRPHFESLGLVLVVLMPKSSVLVLKVGLGLCLSIVFWQLNKFGIITLILKCKIT